MLSGRAAILAGVAAAILPLCVMVGLQSAKAQSARGSTPAAPSAGEVMRVYQGVSDRGSIQEALDNAVAAALRSLPGADRRVRYRLREITGEQGGIAGVNRVKVSIETLNGETVVSPRSTGPAQVDTLPRALTAELALRPDRLRQGQTATFELTVRNRSDQPARVTFPTGQQFDFEVWRDNRVVWKWSRDRAFTQAVSTLALQPGQAMTFTGRWNLRNNLGERVIPGRYEVRGFLASGTDGRNIGKLVGDTEFFTVVQR